MSRDRWDETGDPQETEHWRSVLPDLSVAASDDLTGVGNTLARAAEVRQRHVLEFKHLTGPRGSWHGSTTSGLTRVCDWSPLTGQELSEGREGSPFGLCRGVPCGLVDVTLPGDVEKALDFAIRVTVPPSFVPSGLLVLEGVPIVVHRHQPYRPLPGTADETWPRERPVPEYLGALAQIS